MPGARAVAPHRVDSPQNRDRVDPQRRQIGEHLGTAVGQHAIDDHDWLAIGRSGQQTEPRRGAVPNQQLE